jgi:hypothetical protein
MRDVIERLIRAEDADWKLDRTCLAGTRRDILRRIQDWVGGPHDASTQVMWLSGMAGLGKSSIAHSVCQRLSAANRLGASFFFSRNTSDRQSPARLFTTLAYYLAFAMPSYCKHLCAILEKSPVPSDSTRQLNALLTEPLSHSTPPTQPFIIVLDALDECQDLHLTRSFLMALVSQLPRMARHVKLFVTSRPDHRVDQALKNVSSQRIRMTIDEPTTQEDIRHYINSTMTEASFGDETLTAADWPTESEREKLVAQAGCLFLWASTACAFIQQGTHPKQHMAIILALRALPDAPEDKQYRLYESTLGHAMQQARASDYMTDFQLVVGAIIALKDPLSSAALGRLLETDSVGPIIRSLSYILHASSQNDPIQTIHPSLRRYLTTESTSPFHVDTQAQDSLLSRRSFDLIHDILRRDICQLGGLADTANLEIPDLPTRLANRLPPEVQYACRFWAAHAISVLDDATLLPLLRRFYEFDLFHWIEATSLLGRVSEAIDSLRMVRSRLQQGANITRSWLKVGHLVYMHAKYHD